MTEPAREETPLTPVFDFITLHPWWTLALALVLTVGAGASVVDPRTGEPRLSFDPSANRMLPEGDESKIFYDRVRKIFGNDETMLVAVHTTDIFSPQGFSTIIKVHEAIERIEEVHHCTSLYNASNINGTEDGLEVGPLFEDVPEDPATYEQLRAVALSNPVFRGNLVSADSTTAVILVHFLDFSDSEFVDRGIDARIEAIADRESGDAGG